MVKFSKELEGQLIPEWKEAFVNYWQLKKYVKRIKLSMKHKQPYESSATTTNDGIVGSSVLDPIRNLSQKILERFHPSSNATDIIQVRKKSTEAYGEVYKTELLHLFSEEDEVKMFFERLDEELNKVNQFYKTKESEFVERGEALNKQLQILSDLKQLIQEQRRKNSSSNHYAKNLCRSQLSSNHNFDFSGEPDNADMQSEISDTDDTMKITTDAQMTTNDDALIDSFSNNCYNGNSSPKSNRKRSNCINKVSKKFIKVVKRKNLDNIGTSMSTPAISAFTSKLWQDLADQNLKKDNPGDLVIKRKKVQCAEKMIRGAFSELYRGLGLLKNYSSLNIVAFTKILKKFDKVANQQASETYLKVVKKSHFFTSDEVVREMVEIESIFTRHFTNGDRKKAMQFLRPRRQRDTHVVTFFAGLFTGCFITLFSIYAILAHLAGIFSSSSSDISYMETIYPVFSIFALLSLHLFMYGCNLFIWQSVRINYNFIFEFSPNTALKYRDAFLLSTTLMTSIVMAMVVHLILRSSGFSSNQIDIIPGILLLVFFALLICPFNVFYRSTRFCFIRIIRNIVCSPFYKVVMVDFFMADQLTSQIPLLRHLETTACYFIAENFRTHQFDTCKSGILYRELAYVVSFLPYYWRAMQCARRWFDESDLNHLANMGKYVSAMVAAGVRLTYSKEPDQMWFALVLITSVVATVYQLYWDFVKDWGFLNPKSKNSWLRDDLILKNKGIYYASMALNVILRVAWVETVMRFQVGVFQSRLLDFLLASSEVIRRGHWNFYRLENEHLNNVGKFRAIKNVPLPFREMDSDG